MYKWYKCECWVPHVFVMVDPEVLMITRSNGEVSSLLRWRFGRALIVRFSELKTFPISDAEQSIYPLSSMKN